MSYASTAFVPAELQPERELEFRAGERRFIALVFAPQELPGSAPSYRAVVVFERVRMHYTVETREGKREWREGTDERPRGCGAWQAGRLVEIEPMPPAVRAVLPGVLRSALDATEGDAR